MCSCRPWEMNWRSEESYTARGTVEVAVEMGQCSIGDDRRGNTVLGPRGQWCWYEYIGNRAGVSFGVNSEQCGGWWEGWGEMEKPVGSDLRGMNIVSLPCERDRCGEQAGGPGALCIVLMLRKLITEWNLSPGNLDPMGWAYSSNFLRLQLLKISSTSNRAKIKRDKRGDIEFVEKILATIGSWGKLWRKKASNSWMKQNCSSNRHLKHHLFVTFTILAFKPWVSILSHTWEAEDPWGFNLLFTPILLSPFPKWKKRWKERNY